MVDIPLSDFRKMAIEEFDTSKLLKHAAQQAAARGYDKFPIVDVDSLHAAFTVEEVRELVREFVRKRVQDDRKKAFYLDFQMDVQLQRAIVEACKASNQEAAKIKEYEHFALAK